MKILGGVFLFPQSTPTSAKNNLLIAFFNLGRRWTTIPDEKRDAAFLQRRDQRREKRLSVKRVLLLEFGLEDPLRCRCSQK